MLFRDGEPAPVGRRRVDGRRRPAADPRPARLGAGRRRRRRRDRGRGAALVRRAGRRTSSRRSTVRRGRRASRRDRRGGLEALGHPASLGPSRSTARLGHEHAIELVDGGPAARTARSRPRRTRAATGCRPSGDGRRSGPCAILARAGGGLRSHRRRHRSRRRSQRGGTRDLERRPELPVHERDRGGSRRARSPRSSRRARAWPPRSRPRRRRSTRNDRWWVWKCPTPGCPGLLHVAGYAAEKHAVYVVCDGTCAQDLPALSAGRRRPPPTVDRRAGPPTLRRSRRLLLDALGIAVSAVGFGFVYGLSARDGRLLAVEAMAMSVIVFAGAAQFAAVGLRRGGLAWLPIVLLDRPPQRPPPALLGGARAVAAAASRSSSGR